MKFGHAVKNLRMELGLTQAELAQSLKVNAVTVGRWENGKTLPTRFMKAALLELARTKGASANCLALLASSMDTASREKLALSGEGLAGEGLYAPEHASIRQLVDGASFPIYVCDMETDELLYINQSARAMTQDSEPVIGKKCYACLMNRDGPCDFCHKDDLVEGAFKTFDASLPPHGTACRVQGKRTMWNGRRAQIRYILEQKPSPVQPADPGPCAWWEEFDNPESGPAIQQIKTVVENINGGVSVVVYEDDGTVRHAYANQGYYALFGYTKEQFFAEQKAPHDSVYPADRDEASRAMDEVKRTMVGASFRYRIIRRDKSIAYVRCNASVTTLAGVKGKVLIALLTDITRSVQAEQQAIISGRRLDAIMKNMDSAVTASVTEPDGSVSFLFTNDMYTVMLGYTKEQYDAEVSDPFLCVHPKDRDAVRTVFLSLAGVGDTKDLQCRIITRDGAVKWVQAHITLMSFPDARAPVHLSVISDITPVVQAQETLAARHDRISELLNDTPSGIAVVEVDTTKPEESFRTVYYNDRFISFSGYSREEYAVLIRENEMALVFEEDIPSLLDCVRKLCQDNVGASADILVRGHRKDGGFVWLLLTGQLAEKRENLCVINIAMMDVTDRQKAIDRQRISDEMLRIAAETDKRFMVVYDLKACSCRVESRTLFSANYGDVFENVPQSLIEKGIVAPGSAPEFRALFTRLHAGEKAIRTSFLLRTAPDKYEWFECNTASVFDDDGLPNQAVLVFHNITEQRVKEAVFKKWQQSIDARPPASYSLFRCNLNRDDIFDEQAGELLKVIFPSRSMSFNDRTKHYAEEYVFPDDREAIIRQLNSDALLAMFYRGEHFSALDYRETGADGDTLWRRLTIETVEYPDSTEVQAFLLFEDIDDEKRAELAAKELAESDPLTGAYNRLAFAERVDAFLSESHNTRCALIMLDMDGFKQLNDTFGHAAGDQALQEVTAVLRSFTRPGDLVCRLGGDEFLVWLQDVPYDAFIAKTAREMCEHIRKAYSQEVLLSASAGISVCPRDGISFDELYHCADRALYKVKQTGKGSHAFFSAGAEAQAEDTAQALPDVRQGPAAAVTKRRMLIVDDSESSRATLKHIFQDDYLIETAKNGAEAMVRLRHFGVSVSVVLLDLIMPGVDGFAVLRRMQLDPDLRTIPVIVVTGDEERSTLLKAFDLGAAEYVSKPVDVEIIRIRVRSVISKAENERLRAQNSYLMLQRDEEAKYHTVLESTGTVVIEYDWRNHVFIYGGEIARYIAGNYDHRGLWQVFLSDMVADSGDVKVLQDALISLAGNRKETRDSRLVMLKTPGGAKHWFRMNMYKSVDDYGLTEKLIITFNDVHDEVQANERLLFQATRDALTGLYNRAGFLDKAAELIAGKNAGYYVMACIDIDKFKVINDQYGIEKGDEVLRHVASTVGDFVRAQGGICCRYSADKFAVLYPAKLLNTKELDENHKAAAAPPCLPRTLRIRMGRCLINDTSLPVSAMFDRASMAQALAKERYDTFIMDYDESMRDSLLKEQQVVGDMVDALDKGEFVPWFQPQYNHATGALIGAEALVRWRRNGKIIPPGDFIPMFEKNGFVYEVDQSIWRQVCALLRRWLDQGKRPLPLSVNISRHDMFQEDFVAVLTGLVEEYRLPAELLRLEITESAFSADTSVITDIAGRLVAAGFTVEIDDFGSGYSSLNTLKDVPASILKLDMRFFETTENSGKGGNIVEAIVRMAKWLDMAVIAEGVEEKAQADYLKSIGCFYIQGYYYSRPLPLDEYEKCMEQGHAEHDLNHTETLETMDADLFWDPKSMETLIFNSYVGGACIFEMHDGAMELLRCNDQYVNELHGLVSRSDDMRNMDVFSLMDDKERRKLADALRQALDTGAEASCETRLTKGEQTEYIRQTSRVIAKSPDRTLYYSVIQNLTHQRRMEQERTRDAERLSIIMSNVNGGVSAIEINDDGTSRLIFHNDKYFELFGYTQAPEEERGLDPMRFIIPEDFPAVMKAVNQLKKDGKPLVIDYGIIKKDGRRAQIRTNASLMTMEGYGPIITSVLTDITEQRALEDKLRAVVDNINGGVIATYFQEGAPRYVLSNDRYYEIFGYTREQYAAEVTDVTRIMHPDDRARVLAFFSQAMLDKTPFTVEFRIIRRNGALRHILCNGSIMHIFGVKEPVMLGVFNDITALREAQLKEQSLTRQLNTIVANIQGGVTASTVDSESNISIAYANDGYYAMFGYTKEQFEKEIHNALDLIVPQDRDRAIATVARILRNRGQETYEYRCVKRDGTVIWVQTSNTVTALADVGETVLLAVSTDITALRRAEVESRETTDRMSAVMNALTSGISATAFYRDHVEFLFANDLFYKLHGIEKGAEDHDVFRNILNYTSAEDRASISARLKQIRTIGQSAVLEYRIHRPDGATRWIQANIAVSAVLGVAVPVQVAVFTDITEEKEAGEQIRFLNKSAGEILAQPDSEKAIGHTLGKLLDYFAGERSYIFELDDDRQTSDNTYELCAPGVTPEKEGLQGVPYATQQYWFDAFEKTGFVVISDVSAIGDDQAAMRDILQPQGIRSIIVAPLWRDGKLIGYLGVDNPSRAMEQVGQLIALADYIAVLLTRRDLMKAVEHERQTVQQLMDDTPGGFLRMELLQDAPPVIVTVNEGLCQMLNMTRDEVMQAYGGNVYASLSPEDAAAAPAQLARAFAAGGEYTGTCRLHRKDGSSFWAMLFGRFVRGEGGRQYLNAYFTDITEQRTIEQVQSELLENLPAGAALYAYDGEHIRVIHINRHYWELVGRTALSPKEISAFGPFHPDDRALVSEELKASIRQGRNGACSARILCGDGGYRAFRILTNNVREPSGNYLLYATFAPISGEEEAIQNMLPMALSTIVSSTDDMSYVKDKDLRYVCVSRSIAEMAGAESPRDLVGKTAGEVFAPAYAEKFDEDDRLVIASGKPVVRMLEHIPQQDGSVRLARTTKFPILDTAGKAMGIYCISHDITAQKEKESQLQLLTDSIPGGLAAYSISHAGISTLYYNDGFYDYSGYTREEYEALTAQEPLALILPEDRPILRSMMRRLAHVREDGMTDTCAYRCRTKAGEIRWMSMKAVLSQVGDDAYVLNAVQLDITERMAAEKRQGELLDNLPFGAAMYAYDGKSLTALHINRQYNRLVNREIDTSLAGFAPVDAIHPDDRKLVFDEIHRAIAEKSNAECDIRLLYGKREYRPFHLDGSIVPVGDGKYVLYVAYAPITDKEQELKTTSERLKLLSDSIPGGIATFRCLPDEIQPIYFNDGICTLTGYSREEIESDFSVLGLIFDEDKPVIKDQFRLLMKGETALDYTVRIHTKTGGYKWVECMASLTGQEQGDAYLVSTVITDVTERQEESERLRVSEELNRLAIDQSGKIISRYDVKTRTLTLPYSLPDIFSATAAQTISPEEQVRLEHISPDTADAYASVFSRIHKGHTSGEAIYQQSSTLGWRWLKSRFTTVFGRDGKPVSAVVTFEDITEQREKEAVYTRWQNAMAERSPDSYTIVRCNLNKSNILDSWDGNLLQLRFTDPAQPFNARTAFYADRFVYSEDKSAFLTFLNSDTMLAEYHRGHRSDALEYREQKEDGTLRWLRLTVDLVEYPDSTEVEAYLLFEDIDEEKHALLTTIHRAETDPLTGVLNRTAFAQRVNDLIGRFDSRACHGLFMLDVDDFKQVNDIFGHGAGDQTLTDIAHALTRLCRKDDVVGRLGGDEFFVFLANIGSAEAAAKKARRLCDMTRKALSAQVRLSISIGIALYPADGNGFEALYKAADEALYRTKNAGKDGYSFCSGDPVVGVGAKGQAAPPAPGAGARRRQTAPRVLVVTNSKALQADLAALLKNAYITESAMDGPAALAALDHFATAVSAVLFDMDMPDITGAELLKNVREDEKTRTIPVLVLADDHHRDAALAAIGAGAFDIVKKPVEADILRIRLEGAVRKAENERLRAQNSYLSMRSAEAAGYRTALERTGMLVVTLDLEDEAFSYSPAMGETLAGQYDARPLWDILQADEVADLQAAEDLHRLVTRLALDKERTEDAMTVRLKTRGGLFTAFRLNAFKEPDDYGVAAKVVLTLREQKAPEKR